MAFPKWPGLKDPDDVLDYAMDWTNRLAEGETIISGVFSVVSGTVSIDSQAVVASEVICWLSGGADGETATLLCRVATSEARQMDQSIQLKIKTK